jgi:hypothetical protein
MKIKKLGFLHYLVAFMVCTILGGWVSFHLLASQFTSPRAEPLLTEKPSNFIPLTGLLQQNFLLIEVDKLNHTQPTPKSIWAVFSVPTTPAFITFKQLYPSTSEPQLAASLQQSFLLNGEKRPADDFLQIIIDRFRLDGIIIVDEYAFQEFNTWLHIPQDSPHNESEKLSSAETLIQFCEQVNQNNLPKQISWESILSDHFVSDIEINLAVRTWKALTLESGNHHCEVIP